LPRRQPNQEHNNNERQGSFIYPLPAGSGKGQDLLLVRLRPEQEAAVLRWLAQGHRVLASGVDRAARPDCLLLRLQAEQQGTAVRRHPQQPAERRGLSRAGISANVTFGPTRSAGTRWKRACSAPGATPRCCMAFPQVLHRSWWRLRTCASTSLVRPCFVKVTTPSPPP